jgi:hypothetical protein
VALETIEKLEGSVWPDPWSDHLLDSSVSQAAHEAPVISNWIAEIQLERKAAELDLRRQHGDGRMTRDEIRSLVEQLKGIVAILGTADPQDRRAVYQELNVSIDYHPDGKLHVKAGPSACTNERVGWATCTMTPRVATVGEFLLDA